VPQGPGLWIACLFACASFVVLSFLINSFIAQRRIRLSLYMASVYAAFGFTSAICLECILSSAYVRLVGGRLWTYHLLPAHEGNVTLLSVLVWPAFALHCYFQTVGLRARRFALADSLGFTCLLMTFEATLLFEMAGNLYFLVVRGDYLAYYHPADLWHLTSLQAMPVYAVAAGWTFYCTRFITLAALTSWLWPVLVFAAGLVFLLAG
jgi:hypothetical protein